MSSAVTRTAAPQSVRIVIADEHAIFRHGLRMLLEVETSHRIVGEAGDGPMAVALVRVHKPDLLLLGTGSVDRFSRDILREIEALGLPVRTILLTGPVDVDDALDVSSRGAHAVVRKNAAAGALFDSIARVMAGQAASSPGSAAGAAAAPNPFGLTARELEILRAIMAGSSNKAIALRCSISENTVKRHLAHIFDKVGASNRVELAMFADHHQLVGVS
jgi:DNA-binding NarL/FixJ family response regulator